MTFQPLGPLEPDRARNNPSVLQSVTNLVPTADGWGPLKGIVPTPSVTEYLLDENGEIITDENDDPITLALNGYGIVGSATLPEDCMGMFAARKKDGTEVIFVGTATKLLRFNRFALTWEDVSGMTYSAAVRWSWVKWGDKVFCQNGSNPEQMIDIENDDVFSDNADAPICRYLVQIGNFIFRFYIVSWAAEPTFVGPLAFMCSALEDPEDCILQNLNWCDAQFVPFGDEIMGAVPVTGGAHIWLRSGVVPMSIVMSNGVTFALGEGDATRGTPSPYALCGFGQDRYLAYTDDGFWSYTGSFTAIGQDRINATFLKIVDQDTFVDVLAVYDPETAVVWIVYTNNDGQRRMLGYHHLLDRFTASDTSVQAACVCRTFIYTESNPPILKANQPRFAIIDENRQLGYRAGTAMAAELLTNEIQNSEDRTFINKAQLSGDPLPDDYEIEVITRDINGGAPRSRRATNSDRSGNSMFRASGRNLQLRLSIYPGVDWTTINGVNLPPKKAGRS